MEHNQPAPLRFSCSYVGATAPGEFGCFDKKGGSSLVGGYFARPPNMFKGCSSKPVQSTGTVESGC